MPKQVPLINKRAAEDMNSPLEKEEVEEALKRVREKAAPGEDGIMVGWLRDGVVGDFVFKLCSKCFESGQMPEAWQRGIILPIPKKRTRGPPDPNLHRGISLLSAVYKVFCTVMKNRVEAYVEGENLLCEEQNGFRKGRGCIDNIMMMVLMGNKCVELNGSMFSAFIDLKKAYDSVDRDLLWGKLESLGIQGKILQSIKAVYSDVKCKVKIGGEVGNEFSVTTGLRQGCVLSPLLFSLYVNDLMEVLRREEIGVRVDNLIIPGLMFADDLVITAEKTSDLNRALEIVHRWCNQWKLRINAEKCSVVHFRKKCVRRSIVEFRIGEEILSMVSEYKYLGIVLNEFLNGEKMREALMDNGRKALYGVMRLVRSLGNVGWATFSKLYTSMVRNTLLYGCEIWGVLSGNDAKLERVQRAAIRSFLGVHSRFPLLGLELEAGLTPLRWEARRRAIRYWVKVHRLRESRLLSKILVWAKGRNDWEDGITKVTQMLGWEKLGRGCREFFRGLSDRQIEEMVNDSMWRKLRLEWVEGCNRSSKLQYWAGVCGDLGYKEWQDGGVVNILNKRHRRLMAELRSGCPKLEVETGRWQKKERGERLCLLCHKAVGDVSHILSECEALDVERKALRATLKDVTDENFAIEVLNSIKDNDVVKRVIAMWRLREDLLV